MRVSRVFPWAVVCLVGCSDAASSVPDKVGVSQLELSAACASAAPVATFRSSISFTSPRTYNPPDCFKGQVVDILSFGAGGFGATGGSAGALSSPEPGVTVEWADSTPADESSCANAWVAAYRFQWDGRAYVTADVQSTVGQWFRDQCLVPKVYLSNIPRGTAQRFAVSARAKPTTTASTRSVRIR